MNLPAIKTPAKPIKLYRFSLSGHSHRVELFLSLLGLPVELINVDLAAGAQKTPEFLEMNPFGQVPVIQDGEVTLADSNAILVYLAGKYDDGRWLPRVIRCRRRMYSGGCRLRRACWHLVRRPRDLTNFSRQHLTPKKSRAGPCACSR